MKNKLGFTLAEQEEINKTVRQFGLENYSRHLNHIILHRTSREHMKGIANLCVLLREKNIPFVTEFTVKGKKGESNRPDILVLKPLVAIEVLHTETNMRFNYKLEKAPDGLLFIKIGSTLATDIQKIEGLL